MFGRRLINAAIAVSLTAAPAAAQSLGDLARQEEARRASAQKAVKTLSNADLEPSAIVSPAGAEPAEPSCYMSKSKGQCVSAEEMVSISVAGAVTTENAPFEKKWRRDAEELRSQIEKTQDAMATLEGIIAGGGRSPSDRKAAEKQLAGARKALDGMKRQWEVFESAAANQRIPRQWLEPVPEFARDPQ
jgi:hypothetical protein